MNVAARPWSLDILSICTGGGGLDLGIELAVPCARAVCMVEREAFAVAHLVSAMEQGFMAPAPVWSDARTFDGRRWRGCVDGLVGGIPCQPHSLAGRKQGQLDERDLWSDARRIVVQSRVWWVLIENVGGMLAAGADEVAGAERVWRDLRKLGFQVEIGLFTAAEVGASHERERLFILGVHDELADAGCDESRARRGDLGEMRGFPEAECRTEHGASVSRGSCAGVADAVCKGLEGRQRRASRSRIEGGAAERGSEGLADTANRRRDGRPASGKRYGSSRAAGGRGVDVVDADSARRQASGSGHPFDAGQQPEPGRGALDDAVSGRRSARRDDHRSDVGYEPDATGQHALDDASRQRERRVAGSVSCSTAANVAGRQDGTEWNADIAGQAVADADIAEFRREPSAGEFAQLQPDDGDGFDLGVFPPGPADLDGWRRVLAHSPDLEPAVRRMADGVAARVDLAGPHAARVERLRMLGNGVVSLEGAHAFRTLCHRLAGRGSAGATRLVRMMEAAE
ncbi:MAG: DNA cytosine methyltransferase [Mesorhizobium sp.]|nr:DNA cytosine methyltransferase [Mesorhizobium sp.]